MLVARLEIWPMGDSSRRRTLATVQIANIHTNHENFADYAVILKDDDHEQWTYLNMFDRNLGATELLTHALDKLSLECSFDEPETT